MVGWLVMVGRSGAELTKPVTGRPAVDRRELRMVFTHKHGAPPRLRGRGLEQECYSRCAGASVNDGKIML
jgi:hypothetical protein